MDYNKVKLGIIGKFKVWNERRLAEAQRQQYYKDEGKLLEVDYSAAEKLEADLLEQKRIKKATRDATRLYKRVYGKNNNDVSKSDFIEDYLVENGLKQKALPDPKTSKKHNFMEKYPTEKSAEELSYEKANQEPEVYYKIGDTIYRTPFLFENWCFKEINNGKNSPVPLITHDEKRYLIQTEKMQPEDKYNMLNKLIDTSLSEIGMDLAMLDEQNSPDSPFSRICRQASYIDYSAKKLYKSGKIEEAIPKLEKMTEKIFQYNQERLKKEQEEMEK